MLSDDKHEEGVVFDNRFHRDLADVRNSSQAQNHPDIELMVQESQAKSREDRVKNMLSSLTGIEAMDPANSLTKEQDPAAKCPEQSKLKHFKELSVTFGKLIARARIAEEEIFSLIVVSVPGLEVTAGKESESTASSEIELRTISDLQKSVLNRIETGLRVKGLELAELEKGRFLVVLPRTGNDAAKLHKIRLETLLGEEHITRDKVKRVLPCFFGIATFGRHGESWQELVARADLAAESKKEQASS